MTRISQQRQDRIERWRSGPNGFVTKANRQLSQIERRIDRGPQNPRQVRKRGVSADQEDVMFPARITDSESIGDNRWKYAWEEVEIDGDDYTTVEYGRSGTLASDYALNRFEAFHTSQYAWGVDTNGLDYPSEFSPRPVGGGGTTSSHKYDVVVWIRMERDVLGNNRPMFEAMGSHDGECES